MNPTNVNKAEANRDPISGAPGAHPVGTGLGAAAGGIAGGAVAGTLAAGPVGTVIGAAVGAVLGGLGGKAIAEHYDPTVEEAYWRGNFEREPYYQRGMTYDDYAPAYRLGGEARSRAADHSFEDVEGQLAEQYGQVRGQSRLDWERARQATRAGWDRLDVAATRND